MINKTSIKIIKRKDAAAASGKTQILREPEVTTAISQEKVERRLHRKMADTISNWISERKETDRNKEISAIRKLFGDESLLSEAA